MSDVLVIATDRNSLNDVEAIVRRLADQGASVSLVCTFGTRKLPKLGQSEARHLRLDPVFRDSNESTRWEKLAHGVQAQIVSLRLRATPFDKRVAMAATRTSWLAEAASHAAALVAADGASLSAVRALASRNPATWTGHYTEADVDDLVRKVEAKRVAKAAEHLEELADRPLTREDKRGLVAAWNLLFEAKSRQADQVARQAPHYVAELLRLRDFKTAAAMATQALKCRLSPTEVARLKLQLTDARLSMLMPVDQELASILREGLRCSDQAFAAGQLDTASALLVSTLRVAFHRELHADGLYSPLVDNPRDFTKLLRESEAFRALGAPRPLAQERHVAGAPQASHRVLIIPGAYAGFTQTIIAGLSADPGVETRVLDLKNDHPAFRNVTLYPPLLNDRLRQAAGQPHSSATQNEEEHLAWADTIFVDWCDNNAVWTILHAPRDARVVVRIHSIDALSPHLYLMDWSRVSDVIFVGEHIRSLVTQAVPELAQRVTTHVIPNLLRLEHFGLAKNATADRTIAMVGWAQRVKDPLFALEVLARLRAVDDAWRLILIGRDFATMLRGSEARYREAYRRRAVADDVRDAIRYVDFTPKLAEAFCDVGFILSCSRRESQGVALTEGAASGAVPVVRNWPMFAGYDAARSAFPDDWVIDTPDQAVERILLHADSQTRRSAGEAARSYVMERYDQSTVAPRLFEVLVR